MSSSSHTKCNDTTLVIAIIYGELTHPLHHHTLPPIYRDRVSDTHNTTTSHLLLYYFSLPCLLPPPKPWLQLGYMQANYTFYFFLSLIPCFFTHSAIFPFSGENHIWKLKESREKGWALETDAKVISWLNHLTTCVTSEKPLNFSVPQFVIREGEIIVFNGMELQRNSTWNILNS